MGRVMGDWPWRLMLKEVICCTRLHIDLPPGYCKYCFTGRQLHPFFVLFAVGLESRDLMPAGQVLKDSPHPPY